jgi:hypothetical protein
MSFTRTQELVFVVGGVPSATQYLYLDNEDGRPTAIVDVQVWASSADDTSTEEAATTGSASVETSPNTTITATAGPSNTANDPTAIALASASGVTIGRQYLLTEDGTGVSEFVEIASISGLNAKTKHPIKNDYSSGSTFVSTRSSIAVDSTWLADLNNLSPTFNPNPSYRVRWTVTVNGNTAVYMRGFDVVRYHVNHGVTPLAVDAAHRGFLDMLPPDHQVDQGRGLIEAAFESLKYELYGDGKADQAVRNPELLARLVIMRVPYELALDNASRGATNAEALDLAEKRWRQAYDQAFRAPIAAMDESGGGGATQNRPTPLWRR